MGLQEDIPYKSVNYTILPMEGYKMGDIFPEFGSASGSAAGRQKRPAKYRNPQNPEETWSGIGRTPKWVAAIVEERGIDVPAFKAIPMYQIHA